MLGDIERDDYLSRKSVLTAEFAALPTWTEPDSHAAELLAGFLADLASAWRMATPDERNKIARQLFVEVIVENKTAVAVIPRPEMRPFFEHLACQVPDEMTRWRKRRGSVTQLRHDYGYFFVSPELQETLIPAGVSAIRRSTSSLTPAAIRKLRALSSQGASLRAIADAVGVSHETVRKTLLAS
jgi:hypothetical protein